MSSFDRFRFGLSSRFGVAGPMVASLLMLTVSGCIHPLYGPNGVNAQLAQVEVAPIPDRVGHYLAEELKFETDGSGNRPPPRYRLTVTTKETIGGLIVNLHTLTSDAASITLTADYRLAELGSDKEVAKGSASSTASYDRSQQRFANVRAARDAEIRAAGVLADQIRTRIGIALLDQR
ncbi:LPS-assembly lipoprotein [Rhizobiales bacterium GAS191]|jgi:LPS-assembly lipoprotein|nr:LPS-assembly lipoprotein [Rhizobiales bacterium GAS113]SEC13494.1 LPS-assembly lipoprotein [Rhizobiales bacterium GAS191]